jgi:hypothetical protein
MDVFGQLRRRPVVRQWVRDAAKLRINVSITLVVDFI